MLPVRGDESHGAERTVAVDGGSVYPRQECLGDADRSVALCEAGRKSVADLGIIELVNVFKLRMGRSGLSLSG